MRLVGTQALGATQAPGAAVVLPLGDLAAAVRPCVRTLAYALLRATVVTLRSCRPVVSGLVGALRVRHLVPAAGMARAAGRPPFPRARLVTQAPPAQASLPQDPAAQEPAVPSPRAAPQDLPLCHHEVALPADPTAPRRARALLRAATQDWDLDEDLSHDAAMVVTELVANAVDHAGTPSTLRVDLDDRGLYVAVRDGRPDRAPRPRPVDPTAPRGRGLQMIDALTASWGVSVHADGKTVWAMLRRAT
jgi:anti-sigma regulatory factor (Ser/Thr protein kinase)